MLGGGDGARAQDSVSNVRIWSGSSVAKCCMNIQELPDGQAEERSREWTGGGTEATRQPQI
jgi:hypothetical protein